MKLFINYSSLCILITHISLFSFNKTSTVHFDMGKKELMEYYWGGIDFKSHFHHLNLT